jgi:hypothetical protein
VFFYTGIRVPMSNRDNRLVYVMFSGIYWQSFKQQSTSDIWPMRVWISNVIQSINQDAGS